MIKLQEYIHLEKSELLCQSYRSWMAYQDRRHGYCQKAARCVEPAGVEKGAWEQEATKKEGMSQVYLVLPLGAQRSTPRCIP